MSKYLHCLVILLCITCCVQLGSFSQHISDSDFDEFDDSFDDAPKQNNKANVEEKKDPSLTNHNEDVNDVDQNLFDDDFKDTLQADDEDEITIEDEDNDEFSHFADEDEFIGYDGEKPKNRKSKTRHGEPKITIAKVPLHLRSNWDSFYLELLMLVGLAIYFTNFAFGRGKNQKIASFWLEKNKTLLESSFALVGDDGKVEIESRGLVKESENVYILWCSGRTLIEGMLVELRLLKRQDLVGVISQVLRPTTDHLVINFTLEEMDSFVFAFGAKKSLSKLAKDMTDISTYCPERKGAEKLVNGPCSQYVMHSEMFEVTTAILKDPKVSAVLDKFPDSIDYFHFSDQYSGPKQPEESQTKKLAVKKTLIFSFKFPKESQMTEEAIENMRPLVHLTIHLADKLARFRLSKESKAKAEKNRARVDEAFLKATHAARAEIAQNLREEKKRKERERIMNLDDPEKQRKWEEREQKKQQKKKTPKMKTMKIRAM